MRQGLLCSWLEGAHRWLPAAADCAEQLHDEIAVKRVLPFELILDGFARPGTRGWTHSAPIVRNAGPLALFNNAVPQHCRRCLGQLARGQNA
jgi:hypothetical protein